MLFGFAVLALAAVTAVFPRWIELLGVDPDHGSGSLELLLLVALVAVAVASIAGSTVRRLRSR